jgi:F-type H+-transporting ATPase subunit alpha
MLKQAQYSPMPMEEQVVSIYSCTPQEGRASWVRNLAIADIQRYEGELLEFFRARHADILASIRDGGRLEEDTEKKLIAALDDFAKAFQPSQSSEAGQAA